MNNYVYYFVDYNDEIIYVGRTNNLSRRMKEHFKNGHLGKECYEEVKDIMYAETNDSKYDTEICETLLINKYKPKYNKEKVFLENENKTSYKLIDLTFKKLNLYFENDEIKISTSNFKYPCYNNKLTHNDRCCKLIDYNIGNIKHRIGKYKKYNKDIFENNEKIYEILPTIYEKIRENILYDESNVDEPIGKCDFLDTTFVAFDINILNELNLNIETLLSLAHCGFIFRLANTIYAAPLHTDDIIKKFNEKYLDI